MTDPQRSTLTAEIPGAAGPAGAAGVAVDQPLDVLEASGLIRLAARDPELEYLFRHVLVQDAAYESLLKQERRRLHAAVAESIERLAPERRSELAGMLAWHYEAAGDHERAFGCLVEAGWGAVRRYANEEAWSFFERALAIMPTDDESPERLRQRVEIALGQVRAGFVTRQSQAMVAIIEAALPLAEQLGDRALLGRVLVWIAFTRWLIGDRYVPGTPFGDAIDRALAIAEETGDGNLRGLALTILGRSSLLSVDPERAAAVLAEAITLTSDADFIGASMAANTLAGALGVLGRFDEADEAIVRARELAQQSGDPTAILDANISASMLAVERGDVEQAATEGRRNADRAAELHAGPCAVVANYVAGDAERRLGNFGAAVAPLELSIDLANQNAFQWFGTMSTASLSTAQCAIGDLDAARRGWEAALDRARQFEDPGMEASILAMRASALAKVDGVDPEVVLADFDRAAALDEQIGARPRLAAVLEQRADFAEGLGRSDRAVADRERARALYADMGIAGTRTSGRARSGAVGSA